MTTLLALKAPADSPTFTGTAAFATINAAQFNASAFSAKADVLEASLFAADAGSTDDYVITLTPAITSYVTGTFYSFKANTANTGAATLNINGLGAKTIKKAAGGVTTDLATNDIRAGQWVIVQYDGTNLQMQSTLGNAGGGSGTVTTVSVVSANNATGSVATATTTPAITLTPTTASVGDATTDFADTQFVDTATGLTFNAQTGTTYTLVLSDGYPGNGGVSMNNASANTLTVPTNASVAFPIKTQIVVQMLGAGATSIAAAGGVTINSPGGYLTIGSQYSMVALIKTGTNTWQLTGSVSLPYAYGRFTAQTAAGNITGATITVGASDSSYQVSGNINVTAATVLSTSLNCSYTDETNTSRVMIIPVNGLAGNFVSGGLLTTTGPFESAVMHIRCKAATTITLSTASGTFTSVTYNAEGFIKQIQ